MPNIDIDDFARIREINVIRLKEAKEQGKKVVGVYCTYCPQELIIAAGAIPVSLCGTREEPIHFAEEHLPRNLCPLIKSSYGFAISDTCPFFHFSDLIIGETTCDGKKKMFEFLNTIKPVHVMQLPHIQEDKAGLQLWINEIRKLRSTLEQVLGVTITDTDIWQAIDKVNRETRASKAICDLNKNDPPLLKGMDLLTVLYSRSFNSDREETILMLNSLADSLQEIPLADRGAAGRPRVILTGCPVGLGSEKVVRLIEELGAYLVAMENCSGYKTLELQCDTSFTDPVAALAHKYLRIPCSCMSPNPYRLQLLETMIEEFKADAVIDLTWQACHTYNIEATSIGRMVKEKGLPYLHLESDYSDSDLESLKLRIEALLEMVGK